MNPPILKKYGSIIIGSGTLLLLALGMSLIYKYIDGKFVKTVFLIFLSGLAIACQYYIYRNGGWLPKNGKATIHSKIIFFSIIAAVTVLLAFIIALFFIFRY